MANHGFDTQVKLTFLNNDYEAFTNFPILVKLTPPKVDYTKLTAFDEIAFYDKNDSTELKWECERFILDGTSYYWVKVLNIAKSDTDYIYMYYGGNTSVEDVEGVWDTNFKMVQHMKDDPDNAHITDSTSSNNDGTKTAANEPLQIIENIAYSQRFDGVNDLINCGQVSELNETGAFTIEFWIKANVLPFNAQRGVVSRGATTQRVPWIFGLMGTSTLMVQAETVGGSANDIQIISPNLMEDQWHYAVFTWDGTTAIAYLDTVAGIPDTSTEHILASTVDPLYIGDMPVYPNHDGDLDEVRISTGIARSVNWIKAQYSSMIDFYITYSTPTPPPGKTAGQAFFEIPLDNQKLEYKNDAAAGDLTITLHGYKEEL